MSKIGHLDIFYKKTMIKSSLVQLLLILLFSCNIIGYTRLPRLSVCSDGNFLDSFSLKSRSSTCLQARKKNIKSPTAKGFKTKIENETVIVDSVEPPPPTITPVVGGETKTDAKSAEEIFKKYKISDGSALEKKTKNKKSKKPKDSEELAPFGEEIMANMSMETQEKFDKLLVTSTFFALLFTILCGVGISISAFKVAFPQIAIPEQVDSLIVNVLTPAFTPSLGVFFFFSITFGLFKFAQISSSQTVYRED